MFMIIILGFILSFILLIPEVNLLNLYPVTQKDIVNIGKASIPILGTWSHYILIFFIANKTKNVKNLKKQGIKSGIYYVLISLGIIVITVGIFSANVSKLFSLPYFISLKQIDLLNKIYGLESIFLTLLMMGDFAAAGVTVYVIYEIVKNIFDLKDRKEIITPIIFLGFIFALLIANNRFEMQIFTQKIGVYLNLIMEIFIPILLIIVGKVRKKI